MSEIYNDVMVASSIKKLIINKDSYSISTTKMFYIQFNQSDKSASITFEKNNNVIDFTP